MVKSFLPQYHRATIQFKIRGIKTLLGEIKANFDWHTPDDKETVLLPLLYYFCRFVTFLELKTVNVHKEANSK